MYDLAFETWLSDEERLKLASALMSPGTTHFVVILKAAQFSKSKMQVYVNGILALEVGRNEKAEMIKEALKSLSKNLSSKGVARVLKIGKVGGYRKARRINVR